LPTYYLQISSLNQNSVYSLFKKKILKKKEKKHNNVPKSEKKNCLLAFYLQISSLDQERDPSRFKKKEKECY
jgi:hypothetical protein